ncbi:hypothetical protein MNBD_NITROSPINAE01-100 [hydrothermal vent metagenome]|uniref:TMEM205-like domain-containing protein n=1 Tax=hydrothermal vent metagenome TaxID=652676 RepID=A0A3B1BBP3_9ZZZZ
MLIAIKYIHLISVSIWIGAIVFFSFIGAPAIFKTLDRQTAGDVVGAIFPKYFMLGQICSVTALVTLALVGLSTGFQSSVKIGIILLLVMGGIAAYSGMVNGPQARAVKEDIRAETDATKKAELKKKFGKLHGISMVLNIATLLLALSLLFFTVKYIALPL